MTLLLSLLLAAAAPRAAPAADASINGLWWNSDASVAVDVQPCGNLLCGTVTHAEKRAELDARKGGYDHMVGLRVMYGFEHVAQGRWKGNVLIPERKMNVRSTVTRLDAGHIKVEGCILGFLCSHEIWRRTR
ncbi:MAG TPA: DUF2147 domain-containing protein [Allosphingosinicella sp.]